MHIPFLSQPQPFEIHKQLRNLDFRFVLLRSREKIPFEPEWQLVANYAYDDPKLAYHLNHNGNYGVIGGYGDLIAIDFDDLTFQEKILPRLPPTFTVRTGSGKMHKYFRCKGVESFKILDDNKNTLCDVQAKGKQVVGPGSVHPNGNRYEVIDEREIAEISPQQLRNFFYEYIQDKQPGIKQQELAKLKEKVSLLKLLQEYGYDTSRNPTMCRLGHSSTGQACFSFSDEKGLWHCFHCDEGGDVFSLVMLHEKCNFPEAKKKLTKVAGLNPNLGPCAERFRKLTAYRENVEELHKFQPFFYDKNQTYWFWNADNHTWFQVDETDIIRTIDESLGFQGETTQRALIASYLEAVKQCGRGKIPKELPDSWIQFQNCFVDFKTGQKMPISHDFFAVNAIPWPYIENKGTPTIDKLFQEWSGNNLLLKQIIAFCMCQDYFLHRWFCLLGNGRNGKGRYVEIVKKVLGGINCVATDFTSLTTNRFESANLYKKLAVFCGEVDSGILKNTSFLKRMTGQDDIRYEFKGKTAFTAKSYAKLIVLTNCLPVSTDKSFGFGSRPLIINFPNRYSEKIDILSTIPEQEYVSLASQCCDILRELYIQREFAGEGSPEERAQKYEEASNPLSRFIAEKYDKTPDSEHPVFLFRDEFNTYLSQRGVRTWTPQEINTVMKDILGFEERPRYYAPADKQYRCWLGLKPKAKLVTEITKITGFSTQSPIREKRVENDVISVIPVSKDKQAILDYIRKYDTGQGVCFYDTIENLTEEQLNEGIRELKQQCKIFERKPDAWSVLE